MIPIRRARQTAILSAFVLLCLVGLEGPQPLLAQERSGPTENLDAPSYVQPPAEISRILQSDKNYETLEYVSPLGDHFLITHFNEIKSLARRSK